MTFPIQTPSLFLRPFVPEDSAKVFIMSQESGMRDWLPDQVYKDEQTALNVLNDLIAQYDKPATPVNGPYVLAICLKHTGELIGHIGLSPKGTQVEIGYAIEKKYQKQGYASQAVTATTEWGFQHFNLTQILGIVSAENMASCKVLENTGFALFHETMGQLHDRNGLVRTYQKKH